MDAQPSQPRQARMPALPAPPQGGRDNPFEFDSGSPQVCRSLQAIGHDCHAVPTIQVYYVYICVHETATSLL